MEIAAFNVDVCQDGSTALITWISKDAYWSSQHNSSSTYPSYGWVNSTLRKRLQSGGNIYSVIPSEVMNVIKTVRKYDMYYYPGTANIDTKWDKLWIPNKREVFGGSDYEHIGPEYTSYFSTRESRIKKLSGTASNWWLRTVNVYNNGFALVNQDGNYGTITPEKTYGVVIGFCT